MTAIAATGLRTMAFGDQDGTTWGSAWVPHTGSPELLALGADGNAAFVKAQLESEEDEAWRLAGEGLELSSSPAGEAVSSAPEADGVLAGFAQLCRVSGRFQLAGKEHEVDCLGVRAARPRVGGLDGFRSAREVSAWFEPDEALMLLALRPHKGRGHDADLIAASVLDAEGPAAVAEPRLSTTYGASGRVARVGLELWPEAEREEDEQPYPTRAAGQAVGACAEIEADELLLRAQPMHWRSRAREGVGVYLLAEHR